MMRIHTIVGGWGGVELVRAGPFADMVPPSRWSEAVTGPNRWWGRGRGDVADGVPTRLGWEGEGFGGLGPRKRLPDPSLRPLSNPTALRPLLFYPHKKERRGRPEHLLPLGLIHHPIQTRPPLRVVREGPRAASAAMAAVAAADAVAGRGITALQSALGDEIFYFSFSE